jgi:hypothetical protein
VAPAASDARDATIRYADATRDWTAPKVESAVDWAVPRVESARDWAAPHVETAVDWAAPKVEPAVDKIKSDFLPVVADAVASALAATEPARSEVATRGSAAFAAIKGELDPPKQSRHRFRKLLLFGGLLAAAYAGWKAFTRQSADPVDAWTTAPRPAQPGTSRVGSVPAAPAPAPTIPTDDPAGAGPDEALADESDEQAAGPATTTTEAVTPAQAKKVSAAAAKGPSGSAKPGGSKPAPKG